MSTGTTHLSIGEVLSLLQAEFPDVTISKIRFLESQGLIEPERTASGYRKFFESDIDQLRWILRQQRDNFLPLKVIKKMLDEGTDQLDPETSPQPTLWTGAADDEVEAGTAEDDDDDDDADDADDAATTPMSGPPPEPATRLDSVPAGTGSTRSTGKDPRWSAIR